MSKEPLGAVPPAEMCRLRALSQPSLNPPIGDLFYYIVGNDLRIQRGFQSSLAFIPRLYYFRNYFHAYAFWLSVRDKKVSAYRALNHFPVESYPIVTAKPKRR